MGSTPGGEEMNGDVEGDHTVTLSVTQHNHDDVCIIIPPLQPTAAAALPNSDHHSPQPHPPTIKPSIFRGKKKAVVSVLAFCKDWLRHPMNVAIFFWSLPVLFFLTLLFLLLTGLADDLFPTDATRDRWIEICNQVLNMLFTLLSLYQHPVLFHHLAMLCRWRYPDDVVALRRAYCKIQGGWGGVNERAHIAVVVGLLHIACLAQYALCGLYWGYSSAERPEFSDDLCDVGGILAPVLAAVYTSYSPLGRGPGPDLDDEESRRAGSDQSVRGDSIVVPKKDSEGVSMPLLVLTDEWAGELWNCSDDPKGFGLALFCGPCLFGYNTSRLGLGNAPVHAATLLLLCVAPFWVFGITARNVENRDLRKAIRFVGVMLCPLGLTYGGFWRVQLRQRLRIHGRRLVRWAPRSVRDYLGWVFCWPCSLAQEVRTADLYFGIHGIESGSSRGDSSGKSGETRNYSPSLPATPETAASGAHPADCRFPIGGDSMLAAPTQPVMVPEAGGGLEELKVPLLGSSESYSHREGSQTGQGNVCDTQTQLRLDINELVQIQSGET